MSNAIAVGWSLLPFVIVIIVSILLRKILIRVLGETNPINSYVLVIIPIMAVLLGAYTLARPVFVGQRSVEVVPNTQMQIAGGAYTIDESWRNSPFKQDEKQSDPIDHIHVGDVIVYKGGTKKAYENQSVVPTLQVGRVIGVPGNRIEAYATESGGQHAFGLLIDGKKADAEGIRSTDFIGINDVRFGLTVPAGSLWVVIDKGRRTGVFESDSPYVGPIREAQIVGKINAWAVQDFEKVVDSKK